MQPLKNEGDSSILAWLARALRLKSDPIVFFGSAGLILAFVLWGTFFSQSAKTLLSSVQAAISSHCGWVYHGSVTFCLLFCLAICFTPYGSVRLGRDDEQPRYSLLTWFALLFSAGMGIGVLFWSVAEPLTHFQQPPVGEAGTAAAATRAMDITLLHWGLHGWCVYAVVGLGLALAAYRHGLPLTFRSALYPIFGERVHGPIGRAVDIFAVLGTMFGVATSLGLGAQQINAGLHYLFDVPKNVTVQLLLIAGITGLATASVLSGLDRGIVWLSRLAVWLALPLLVFILICGPTGVALRAVAQYSGHYLATIAAQGFWSNLGGSTKWQGAWTQFYWGWWIAWAPFVGMFVARVSRGRTVREFILGVLLAPTAVTCVWFCVFGGIALDAVRHGNQALASVVLDDFTIAIFVFFEAFPLSRLLCVFGLLLIIVFFVTSSDSASLVIDYIAAGGDQNPPKQQRVFWATAEGGVAAVLLLGGGLVPMQTLQLLTGLPLAVVLLLICLAVVQFLRSERRAETVPLESAPKEMQR